MPREDPISLGVEKRINHLCGHFTQRSVADSYRRISVGVVTGGDDGTDVARPSLRACFKSVEEKCCKYL